MSKPHLAWTRPDLSARENALLIAAYLCDKEKVREKGLNRGVWVERFLAAVGLGPGYAWCAALVTFALREAGWQGGYPKGPAAVRNWAKWAEETGRITKSPQRGDLFFWLNPGGTGHIGFVRGVTATHVETIEGNAQAGRGGDQREGDGVYRRSRQRTADLRFISLR
jgi:hypothetical protein